MIFHLNNCKKILRPLFCHFLTNFTILRPKNFSGHRQFFGASFELFGRKFGHLATVDRGLEGLIVGHNISVTGIVPPPEGVQAIQSLPLPLSVWRALQGFLGLVNYYWQFVASEAAIIRPLTVALKDGKAGGSKRQWSDEMPAPFQAAKAALT
jgi:hypothetical protein